VIGINRPRATTALKSKAVEEDDRPLAYSPKRVKPVESKPQSKEAQIGTAIDTIIEYPDEYYLVDSNHPIFENSPSNIRKTTDTKDEVILKYETVLRDMNIEFKQLVKRNRFLEMRLDDEVRDSESKTKLIARLQQEIDELKSGRTHHYDTYNSEIGKSNSSIHS
jgi:hypothetical protein